MLMRTFTTMTMPMPSPILDHVITFSARAVRNCALPLRESAMTRITITAKITIGASKRGFVHPIIGPRPKMQKTPAKKPMMSAPVEPISALQLCVVAQNRHHAISYR